MERDTACAYEILNLGLTCDLQLTTSAGNNDKPVMATILDRSGHEQANIDKHEESQEDEVHIVVLHVWS
jgi:hypothetical protein